eukprot:539070-Pyramimonas_sp.AAC.1
MKKEKRNTCLEVASSKFKFEVARIPPSGIERKPEGLPSFGFLDGLPGLAPTPDFRSVRATRVLLGGDPPAGGPGKEAAQ